MSKEKEKKQLQILVVLVILAGGVAAYSFGFSGEENKPAPVANEQAADANAANGQNSAAADAGKNTANAKKKVEVIEELKMPAFEGYDFEIVAWKWGKPIWERGVKRSIGESWPADPFRVLNIDVVDPERHAEIEDVKKAWQIQGVTKTRAWVEVQVVDEKGKPKIENEQIVTVMKLQNIYEVWFKDKESPFRVGDRLTDTRFTITKIFRNRHSKDAKGDDQHMGEGIVLTGDTGSTLVLWLAKS